MPTTNNQLHFAGTIDEAVAQSIHAMGRKAARLGLSLSPEELAWCEREQAGWSPEQRFIRGIFAGGTFCYQAQQIQ